MDSIAIPSGTHMESFWKIIMKSLWDPMEAYQNFCGIPIEVHIETLWNHCGILMESLIIWIPLESPWNPSGSWYPAGILWNTGGILWNP